MVICLFGENCTGKSSIANELATRLNAELVTGKDYLRLAKSEAEAKRAFTARLSEHLASNRALVYVASEQEQLALRREYIDSVVGNLARELDNTYVVDEHGNKRKLRRKGEK